MHSVVSTEPPPPTAPRPHKQLLRVLLSDIAWGTVTPGGRLAREQDLASQFGVSRAVVREALRGLEDRDVVRVRHGYGAVVRPPAEWSILDEDVLAAVMASPLAADVLAEFFESRRVVEIEAAAIAAERADAQQLTALTNALVRMTAAVERAGRGESAHELFGAAHVEFHEVVIDAARNRVLARMVRPVQRALLGPPPPRALPDLCDEGSVAEHKAILAAIASRDAEGARRAMAAHLDTVETRLARHAAGGDEWRRAGSDAAEEPAP